jgi:intracellular multiplication protein IcmQ
MPIDEHNTKEQQAKLIEIVRQTIERDEALRQKYGVGDKFRFVRDRLQALLANLESELQIQVEETKSTGAITVAADEVVVYVHLFNAHGLNISTWKNMLMPKVFYEYSVNRPIYAEKTQIESIVNAKPNRAQHGYIAVAIKAIDIQKSPLGLTQKDSYGNEILKIKEGSLSINRLVAFVHNGIAYTVTDKGDLIKKE